MNISARGTTHARFDMAGARSGLRKGSRRDSIVQQLAARRDMETRLRKQEDKRIDRLKGQMAEIRASDMDHETRTRIIVGIKQMVEHILQGREQRQEATTELEMMLKQISIEEATTPEERRAVREEEKAESEEEAKERRERDNITSLTRIATRQDNITNLSRVQGQMRVEAGHLSSALSSIGHDRFLEGQLAKLNRGISAIDAAKTMAISSIYREAASMQENQLLEYRKESEEQRNENKIDETT